MSDREKKFKISTDPLGRCPLCGSTLHPHQFFVSGHEVVGREGGLGDRKFECGLRWDSLTDEYWVPEASVPQAVARKLKGAGV